MTRQDYLKRCTELSHKFERKVRAAKACIEIGAAAEASKLHKQAMIIALVWRGTVSKYSKDR